MLDNLLLLWLSAFALMGSPGPATLSLAVVGARFGMRRSIGYLIGIMAGTFCVLLMIATGVTGLILAEPALVVVLSLVAAAYIFFLAWKIATAPVIQRPDAATAAPTLSGGFLLAIANPKAFAAIGAAYSTHTLIEGALLLDTGLKIAAFSVVILAVNGGWLVFGSSLSRFLSDPKTGRIANIIFAAMLVVSMGLALAGIYEDYR